MLHAPHRDQDSAISWSAIRHGSSCILSRAPVLTPSETRRISIIVWTEKLTAQTDCSDLRLGCGQMEQLLFVRMVQMQITTAS